MKSLLCAIPILFLFAGCQKEIPTKMTGYFYTTDKPSNEEQYRLYLDGVDKGELPYIDVSIEKLTGIDSGMKVNALKLEFMSGRHLVESRKSDGKTVASSEMYFEFYKNKTKSGVSGKIGAGGSAMFNSPHNVAIYLAKEPK